MVPALTNSGEWATFRPLPHPDEFRPPQEITRCSRRCPVASADRAAVDAALHRLRRLVIRWIARFDHCSPLFVRCRPGHSAVLPGPVYAGGEPLSGGSRIVMATPPSTAREATTEPPSG